MADWINILIWVIVALMGVVGIIGVRKDQTIFKFILWFVCSMVIIFTFLSVVTNLFVISFIISIVVAFLVVKNE